MNTTTDVGGGKEWRIGGPLLHLRHWASHHVHELPEQDGAYTIGSRDGCWLLLRHKSVSESHAVLVRSGGACALRDNNSKNGIRLNGALRKEFPIFASDEIEIGGVPLIAESESFVKLRKLVERLLGWDEARRADIDLALRELRMAAMRRGKLFLCGDGDLTWVAELLHQHTHGNDRPFIVCGPRRKRGEHDPTAAPYESGMDALRAAAGGTLVVWKNRLPDDYDQLLEAINEPATRVQLVVCSHMYEKQKRLISSLSNPVIIPPLAERAHEIDKIISEFGAEASEALGGTFTDADRDWIRRHEAEALSQIHIAATRLVALRLCGGSITRTAALLGISHSALCEWVARRSLPS